MATKRERGEGQQGSAPVDFVLVGSLVTAISLAIVQLAIVLHIRNCLVDAAASAARYGALADRGPDDARERAKELITTAVTASYASDISVAEANIGEVRVLEVRVRAPLPLVGFAGPPGVLEVTGHAFAQ